MPDSKLEAFVINPDNMEAIIRETQEAQDRILKLKKVDLKELRTTYITI